MMISYTTHIILQFGNKHKKKVFLFFCFCLTNVTICWSIILGNNAFVNSTNELDMDFVVNVQKINHDCRAICFESMLQRKKINSDHVLVDSWNCKSSCSCCTINSVFELLRTKIPLDKCRFCVIDEADHESDKNKGNIIKNGALVMYCRLPNRVKVVLYNATFCGEGVCCNKYHQVGLKGQTYVPDYLHQ